MFFSLSFDKCLLTNTDRCWKFILTFWLQSEKQALEAKLKKTEEDLNRQLNYTQQVNKKTLLKDEHWHDANNPILVIVVKICRSTDHNIVDIYSSPLCCKTICILTNFNIKKLKTPFFTFVYWTHVFLSQTLSEKTKELDKLRSEWTCQSSSLSSRHSQELQLEREKASEVIPPTC